MVRPFGTTILVRHFWLIRNELQKFVELKFEFLGFNQSFTKFKEILAARHTPLELVFQEQSYSGLHSGQSLAWGHFRGDIDDPCSVIADFCVVIADPCGIVVIPEAISGRAVADRCATR